MRILLPLLVIFISLVPATGQDLADLEAFEAQQQANLEELAAMKASLAKRNEAKRALSSSPAVIADVLSQHDQRLADLEHPGEAESRPALQRNIDLTWMVVAGMLVFFMQAGFCMLEMGLVRSKNSINVVMKNVLDISTATISFLLIGFTIMFGASEGGFIGEFVWLPSFDGDSPIWSFFFFHAVFAATACTIASGAMAERTKFIGYVIYTTIFAGLIYPIFGHWAWGSAAAGLVEGFGGAKGWIEQMGFIDFAGSTVVHAIGGACALAGIVIVGPRKGRFTPEGKAVMMNGHNMPLAALGTLILWVGWFGFNAGAGLVAEASIGRICVNTLVGGGAGCLSAMVVFWAVRGVPEPRITLNGAIGGLVSVSAGCAVINPGSAIMVGLIGGVVAIAGALLLEKMQLDDVAGAVPVHLFCGLWGTVAIGFFHEAGMSVGRIGLQSVGALLIAVGAFVAAFVIFKIIDTFVGLRATDIEQEDGLDFTEHSMSAYPDFETAERSTEVPAKADQSPGLPHPAPNPLLYGVPMPPPNQAAPQAMTPPSGSSPYVHPAAPTHPPAAPSP